MGDGGPRSLLYDTNFGNKSFRQLSPDLRLDLELAARTQLMSVVAYASPVSKSELMSSAPTT
jgi:hypothetical protein